MKFSENWLRSLVELPVDTDGLCEQITMLGLEVDGVEPAAPADLDSVVVGRIVSVERHPDADGLVLCSVDTGAESPRQIVCGAPNARPDINVPVALPGATLPGGLHIAVTEIRGVESLGMLCASAELGLDDDAAGLLELDAASTPGRPIRNYLDLDDNVIEIDLTPNRGDCLSILGVAREAAVANAVAFDFEAPKQVQPGLSAELAVKIENPSACAGYCGRLVDGVDATVRTPDWMRERLRRGGVRSLGVVVDVTNYVMLELGQPMHAFDADKLEGGISIRGASNGETLELLDGNTVSLGQGALVIADESGPVALAGIMGGASTAVSSVTRTVFLESATFNPAALAGEGRRYKRHTDALHRFERGVDPALAAQAIERATALICEIAGGKAGPVTTVTGEPLNQSQAINLSHARLLRLLGCDIPSTTVPEILRGLGMDVANGGSEAAWVVTPPSFRFDLSIEADLIEEIARVYGYDRLPSRERRVPVRLSGVSESRVAPNRIRELLLQRGYSEAVTYGFVDPELQRHLDPESSKVDVDNPISAQLAQMRTTLWSSLIPAWLTNQKRREPRIRLFEEGLSFVRDASAEMGIRQNAKVAGIASGLALPESWVNESRNVDFFDLKADLEALINLGGAGGKFEFQRGEHPALHPGRSASVRRDGKTCGWIGELHPKFKNILSVKKIPIVFEVDREVILSTSLTRYQSMSAFPSIRRDLAFLIPDNVSGTALMNTFFGANDDLLKDVFVFDLYEGDDLENGFKSMALGLIFQDDSSTLTDEVVDRSIAHLVSLVEREHGAKIRG